MQNLIEVSTSTQINMMDLVNFTKDIATLNLGYLTIAIAVMAILGGIFIYFNINPLKESLEKQEDKINKVKDETDSLIEDTKKATNDKLENFEKNQTTKLTTLLETKINNFNLEIKNILVSTEKILLEKIEEVSENKDKKVKELLISDTQNKVGAFEKTTLVSIEKLWSEIKNLNRTIKELEAFKYHSEGKMGSIYKTIELLREDIKENSFRIPFTLNNLQKYIKDVPLKPTEVANIEELLGLLDKKYSKQAEEVRKNILYSREN